MSFAGISNSSSSQDSGLRHFLPLPVDEDGGIELQALPPGTALRVQTRNNEYRVVTRANGEVVVSGHPQYCPEPVLVRGLGSAYRTGYVREGYLCPGLRLTFPSDGRRVATSSITSVQRWAER